MVFSNPARWAFEQLLNERDRWLLWAPVAMGLGIAGYFALPHEPPEWLVEIGPWMFLVVIYFRHRAWVALPLAVFFLCLGFSAAQFSTLRHMAPMLDTPAFGRMVEGRVQKLDPVADGARLLLDQLTIQYLPSERTPAQVRVTIKLPRESWPPVGARVRLKAWLNPMTEPVAPGAYDFRRHGFFEGIGAIGWSRGDIKVIETGDPHALRLLSEHMRTLIAARVAEHLQGDSAAISTALLNGEQTGISEIAFQDMRASGLQHILSISGLHIGLVAGLVFFAVRGLLALSPFLALNYPIKKWAALAAIAAVLGYSWLVGAPVPTMRAALMTTIVLLAVLVDRRALSMRLVCLAAGVVLLIFPEALLGVSFQMSFAAVLGMIAVYEARPQDWAALAEREGWLWRTVLYLGGVAGTSLIATAMTTPFTLFHFQVMNWYGVIANMLAVPLTSFWIMPFGLISYLLMPFGLEGWAVTAMGWGVEAMMVIAKTVGSWPGAVTKITMLPLAALTAIVLGGLWLCLWRTSWRWLGLAGIVIGIALALLVTRPDLLVATNGKVWAARMADGRMVYGGARDGNFIIEQWQQQDGGTEFVMQKTAIKNAEPDLDCWKTNCLFERSGARISLIRDPKLLFDACHESNLVVTPFDAYECLETGVTAIDKPMLAARGAHAVYFTDNGMRFETVRRSAGGRPWSTKWQKTESNTVATNPPNDPEPAPDPE